MISHILNSGGNNSLMKHDVVQGNNIVDLDLLRNLNGVPGLNRDNFIYIGNIFSNIKQRNEKIGNDSNLLIVFYVQIMPDDFVMQLHRF